MGDLLMRRYATELVGTFFLVLTIGLTVVQGEAMAPLAIGSALMVMVYMGGHVSGAHYNPAVTLGFLVAGKTSVSEAVAYWISQVVGGLLAALAVLAMIDQPFAPAPGPEVGLLGMLLAEILFTFALMLVIFNVAASPDTEGNSYFGLAIGFTVMVGAWAVGPISGAAFNPAVAIGPTIVDAATGGGTWEWLWIYLVAPALGAVAAVPVFRLQGEGAAGSGS
jgi:aquaporin Z